MEHNDVFLTKQDVADLYNEQEPPGEKKYVVRAEDIQDWEMELPQKAYDKFVDFLAKRAIKGYVILPATEWQELQEMRSK